MDGEQMVRESDFGDYVDLSHLYTSLVGDGFRARRKSGGEHVLLWSTRGSAAPDPRSNEDFARRLRENSLLSIDGIAKVVDVDFSASGRLYVVSDYASSELLLASGADWSSRKKTLCKLFHLVSLLHDEHVVLGDLCRDSFLLMQDGSLRFSSVLGMGLGGDVKLGDTCPDDLLHYLAPEVRRGANPSLSSDVYSLGVYAYEYLVSGRTRGREGELSGHVPFVSCVPSPSSIDDEVPTWMDAVIGKCLSIDENKRFRSGVELSHVFDEALGHRGFAKRISEPWPSMDLVVRQGEVAHYSARRRGGTSASKPSVGNDAKGAGHFSAIIRPVLASLFVLVVVVCAAVSFLKRKDSEPSTTLARPLAEMLGYAPSELKPYLIDLMAEAMPLERKRESLFAISKLEGPVARSAVSAVLMGELGDRLRSYAVEAVLSKLREDGLIRTSRQLGILAKRLTLPKASSSGNTVFVYLLNACREGRDVEHKIEFLKKAYALDRRTSILVTVALILDGRHANEFTPLLRDFIAARAAKAPLDGVYKRGVEALIVSDGVLLYNFRDDVISRLAEMSSADLEWAIVRLAKDTDPIVEKLVVELTSRKTLSPYRQELLEVAGNYKDDNMNLELRRALLQGAFGALSVDSVRLFAHWQSSAAERVLLSICANDTDESVRVAAFDVLASRQPKSKLAASMIKWSTTRYRRYRGKLAKAIGRFALEDSLTDERMEEAFSILLPFVRDGSLLRVFGDLDNPRLIRESLRRFGSMAATKDVARFLSHEDPEVRVEAVRAMARRNSVDDLTRLLTAYAREKDREVCAVYHEVHWVTHGRKSYCSRFLKDDDRK